MLHNNTINENILSMKTLKSILFIICLSTLSLTTVFAGNSDETQKRNVTGFNAIKVSTGIDLFLSQGDTEKVSIVANDDIINDIITKVENGTLHIYQKKKGWTSWWNSYKGSKKAYVTVKDLVKLEATSGSDVETESTIVGETLKVRCSSGSDVELEVKVKNLTVSTSSGSDAKLQGSTKHLEVDASSGSDIKASGLKSQICHADASSGSDISVRVSDEFYGSASSGADIFYSGSPETIDINESSGGDIHHK